MAKFTGKAAPTTKTIEREGVATFVSKTVPGNVEIDRQAQSALNQAITKAKTDGISILKIGKVTAGQPVVKNYNDGVWQLRVVVEFEVPA